MLNYKNTQDEIKIQVHCTIKECNQQVPPKKTNSGCNDKDEVRQAVSRDIWGTPGLALPLALGLVEALTLVPGEHGKDERQ